MTSEALSDLRGRFATTKTIVVKVGTSVVTREDGMVALGRIGCLVEQIAELVRSGKQVVLVASGAIGIGTGKLKEQAMLSRSLRTTLHSANNSLPMPSPPARAAAGQGGLMGLYDVFFSQYGVACGQVLVTEADFASEPRLNRMRSTLQQMMQLGAVPVLNENDVLAIPNRRSLFTDNDSLAVLVAVEMKAELLLLFSDVPGILKEPPQPGKPKNVLPLCTRSTEVQYGAKSARGRGGMQAKVEAALNAAETGVGAVVILSGFEPMGLLRVLRGEALGTVLLAENDPSAVAVRAAVAAAPAAPPAPAPAASASGGAGSAGRAMASASRKASRQLQQLSQAERTALLNGVADALVEAYPAISEANAADVRDAQQAKMSKAMAARLLLPLKKLKGVADGIRSIAAQRDPLWRTVRHMELAPGLELRQETVPIGVLLVIFESRPDVVPQVAALSIATGNGLLLKGGKEAVRTNSVLHETIAAAVERCSGGRVSRHLIGLVETRSQIGDLLQLQDQIDLVIPRGSNDMVQSIMGSTRIPTLGHADGVCHMYVDVDADLAQAARVLVDAKTDYPAACNAVETLLVHEALVKTGGARKLIEAARAANIEVLGGPRAASAFGLKAAPSLHTEYGDLCLCIEIVSSLDQAVDHIHEFGSAHTDVIITRNAKTAEAFLKAVDSANVFHNCSSRFADGYRFGLGAEVGISTSRIHARGPVGVEGLLTTRSRLVSVDKEGHTAGDFASGRARYTHKDIMARL